MDGFRLYAIFGVVSLHLLLLAGMEQGTTLALISWGLFGNVIDTFFIITGFVLFLGVVSRGGEIGSVRDFAIGRGARLLPAYWLSLVVLLALIAVAGFPRELPFPPTLPAPDLAQILVDFSALQMPLRTFYSALPIGFGVNGPLWMISVILGFYLLFPLIARGYYRHPLLGLGIALAVTIGWKLAVVHLPGVFEWMDQSDSPLWMIQFDAINQLPSWALSFALGMTGAWLFVRAGERRLLERARRPALYWGALALIACGVCAYLFADRAYSAEAGIAGSSFARTSIWLPIAYSFARAALFAAIVFGPLWLQKPFDNRAVRKLAELSFGIYLIHFVVCAYLAIVLLELPQDGTATAYLLWFGIVIPISAAYAWVSLRYVEGPARRWARRSAKRRTAEEAPARAAPGPPRPA